jgi:hypothetical protein
VAGWDYFLASEDGNGWSGWFDSSESVMSSASAVQSGGPYLEGALDLEALYGSVPDSVLIAVGGYGTADGGTLYDQAPAGNGDGDIQRLEYYALSLTGTGVPGDVGAEQPVLHSVSPNPVRAGASLRFSMPRAGRAHLGVYDVSGRLVSVLLDGPLPAGEHEATWRGLGRSGGELPSGVYFARLLAPAGQATRKLVLLR